MVTLAPLSRASLIASERHPVEVPASLSACYAYYRGPKAILTTTMRCGVSDGVDVSRERAE